eukprot:scaffold1704_cov246-Pinguiococcus_pyrenoidosus.AAC.20
MSCRVSKSVRGKASTRCARWSRMGLRTPRSSASSTIAACGARGSFRRRSTKEFGEPQFQNWSIGGQRLTSHLLHRYACATSPNVVMKHCVQLPRPLWAEVLDLVSFPAFIDPRHLVMGGHYADIAAEQYGRP